MSVSNLRCISNRLSVKAGMGNRGTNEWNDGMGTRRIRVGMQGIKVGMRGIRVGIQGMEVGMWEIRVGMRGIRVRMGEIRVGIRGI